MECPADRDALRTLLAGVAASEEKKQAGCCVDTSEITDFSALFDGTRRTGVDAFGADDALCWDTSAVTTMYYTFYHIGTGAKSFNAELAWDTSKVTTMGMTFWEATAFNRQLVWDTSSVTTLRRTFYKAGAFNQLLDWDTSSVETLDSTFYYAKKFNQPLAWDTSKVTTLDRTFDGTWGGFGGSGWTGFNSQLVWDTSKVTDMGSTFSYAKAFNQLLDWDTSKVTTLHSTFRAAYTFNSELVWDTSRVTDMYGTFQDIGEAFNSPLAWDTSSVTRFGRMFYGAQNFEQSLSSWDIAGRVVDFERMLGDGPWHPEYPGYNTKLYGNCDAYPGVDMCNDGIDDPCSITGCQDDPQYKETLCEKWGPPSEDPPKGYSFRVFADCVEVGTRGQSTREKCPRTCGLCNTPPAHNGCGGYYRQWAKTRQGGHGGPVAQEPGAGVYTCSDSCL